MTTRQLQGDPEKILAHRARRAIARERMGGSLKHRLTYARLLLAGNMPDEMVAKTTGLDLATVIWLRQEIAAACRGRRR